MMYTTSLGSYTVTALNSEEYHELKREIYTQHSYYLDLEFDHPPTIIDAGAHIGLASLYFKSLWPQAQILAIEPNPDLAAVLRQNIYQNQLQDVAVLQAALSDKTGKTTLYVDDSWHRWYSSGSLHEHAWNNSADTMPVEVSAVTLSSLLSNNEVIDLLKMDIEGMEERVLHAAGDRLQLIQHIILEFHPRPDNQHHHLEKLLREQGFNVSWYVHQKRVSKPPQRQLTLLEAHR